MSVSEYEHSPYGALRAELTQKNRMVACFPDFIGRKRHEVPQCYRANGAICIVNVVAFQEAGTYYGDPLYVYVMPWYRSVDIDNEIDLKFAEFLIENRMKDDK
jgi:N-acylneuraminate cytidylyltransferase/CMP-N,N'-diacetyllegionaminic acid synthase